MCSAKVMSAYPQKRTSRKCSAQEQSMALRPLYLDKALIASHTSKQKLDHTIAPALQADWPQRRITDRTERPFAGRATHRRPRPNARHARKRRRAPATSPPCLSRSVVAENSSHQPSARRRRERLLVTVSRILVGGLEHGLQSINWRALFQWAQFKQRDLIAIDISQRLGI